MGLWVEACDLAEAPTEACSTVWVDVSSAVPFQLTEAHLVNMGQVFAAGFFIVFSFWALGWTGGMILRAIRKG